MRFPCSPETGAQAEYVRNFKTIGDVDVEMVKGEWRDEEDDC